MNGRQIESLLLDFWADLRDPSIMWQVGTLALCLLAAFLVSRAVRLRGIEASGLWGLGVGGAKRLLFPVVALLLVLAERPILAHWQHVNLLRLAVPLLGSMALIRLSVYMLRQALPSGSALAAFERSVSVLAWSVVALHISGLLPEVVDFLEGVAFRIGRQKVSLWMVLQGLFWAGVTVLVALWASSAIEARLMRSESLHTSLRVVLARLTRSLFLLAAILLVLPLVGIDLTVLSVFGGALGVGLGFGLQKIASNYVSGFIILLDRSIRLGDMITADNFTGVVKAITTRYVVVKALDGREAIIPNETLITQTVINQTHSDSMVRLALAVQVDYDTDLDAAIRLMESVARAHPRVLAEPACSACLVRFADSGIDLELGFWIRDPDSGSANVKSDLGRALLTAFRAAGIHIPYPRRVVEIRSPEGIADTGLTR